VRYNPSLAKRKAKKPTKVGRRESKAKTDDRAALFAGLTEALRGQPALLRKVKGRILGNTKPRFGTCDKCDEKAGVEVSSVRGGRIAVRRYCLECASKAGIAVHGWALRAARRARLERARRAKKSKTSK
jgi:hypothetical protein